MEFDAECARTPFSLRLAALKSVVAVIATNIAASGRRCSQKEEIPDTVRLRLNIDKGLKLWLVHPEVRTFPIEDLLSNSA